MQKLVKQLGAAKLTFKHRKKHQKHQFFTDLLEFNIIFNAKFTDIMQKHILYQSEVIYKPCSIHF